MLRIVIDLIRRSPFLVVLLAYATTVAFVIRLEAVDVVHQAVSMTTLAVTLRVLLQVIHSLWLHVKRTPASGYAFMSVTSFVAAAGMLYGLGRDELSLYYLIGHWTLAALVYSAEMHYNELAAAGEITYLTDARPFRWLALGALRFLYGGQPDRVSRAQLFFMVMLTAAVIPAVPH